MQDHAPDAQHLWGEALAWYQERIPGSNAGRSYAASISALSRLSVA